MSRTNIERDILNDDGSKTKYVEQRYTRKYGKSLHQYIEDNQIWRQAQQEIARDARQIISCKTYEDAVKAVEWSDWFSFDAKSNDFMDVLWKESLKKKVNRRPLKKGKLYNAIKFCVVRFPRKKSHGSKVLEVSRKSILGIGTLTRHKRDSSDCSAANLAKIKFAAKAWKACVCDFVPDKGQNVGDDPNTIETLNVVVSMDTEWQAQPNPKANGLGGTIRRNEDVLNVSLAFWLPEYPDIHFEKVVVNKTGQSFNLRQFFVMMVNMVKENVVIRHKFIKLKRINWLLTGYFLGVDWSTLDGWNVLKDSITTIGKDYIFSTRPFVFNTKDQNQLRMSAKYKQEGKEVPDEYKGVENVLTIRDAGLLAPLGGLKVLGEIVGIPKIDTEVDDVKNGKKRGYYKQHMKEYAKDCPKRYFQYVVNDAIIPLKYMQKVVTVYNLSWLPFSSLPMTTANYAMQGVVGALTTSASQQRIFRGDVSFADIKQDPRLAVKDGLGDLYLTSQDGYYGGFNVAFGSFVVCGVVVDTDLSSAYNVAGNLMPYPDYDAERSQSLSDIGDKYVEVAKGTDFGKVYLALQQKLEGFPFVLGAARVSVTYPDGYQGITMTPSRDKDGNPVYVKHLEHEAMPLVDVLDAWEHGASVYVDCIYIPAQHYDHKNAWADQQQTFLNLRQSAKKKRNRYKKGTPQYQKYDGEQLLYKLAANSIYGKSAQSIRPKRKRSYITGLVDDVSISKISDPVIAGAFTAITRYLAHKLYDAVGVTYGSKVLPANVTTDGYTFILPLGSKFNFDAVKSRFDAGLPQYYQDRLLELDYSAGFERKGNSQDFDKSSWVFNLRTRLNGTPDIDCLEALGGIQIHTYTVKDIFNAVKAGEIMLPVKYQKLSNLTEMKYGTRNHMQGVLYEEPMYTRIPLQYDCAYKPVEWIPDSWDGFGFVCEPFDTSKERTTWKKHSKEITDRFNIMISRDRFETYLKTMTGYNFYHVTDLDNADYQHKARQIMAKLHDDTAKVDRTYKSALSRCKQNLKNGKKIGVCPMAVYSNLKRCAGTTSASLSDPHNASSNLSKAKGGSKKQEA